MEFFGLRREEECPVGREECPGAPPLTHPAPAYPLPPRQKTVCYGVVHAIGKWLTSPSPAGP